jgi:hypothetical protein
VFFWHFGNLERNWRCKWLPQNPQVFPKKWKSFPLSDNRSPAFSQTVALAIQMKPSSTKERGTYLKGLSWCETLLFSINLFRRFLNIIKTKWCQFEIIIAKPTQGSPKPIDPLLRTLSGLAWTNRSSISFWSFLSPFISLSTVWISPCLSFTPPRIDLPRPRVWSLFINQTWSHTAHMEPHGQARGPQKPYPPTPRLRWVIRHSAKSAEAWHNHSSQIFYPELRIPLRPRLWSPA